MNKVIYILLLAQLLQTMLIAELTFDKSRKFVETSDKNKTVKKEFYSYIDLTKRLLTNATLTDGLTYLRIDDCVSKHNTGLEVEKFKKLILQDIEDNNMTKAHKASQEKVLWWPMTMAMKVSAGESEIADVKKMFECGNTGKAAISMDSKDIQKGMLSSATMPKRTPSSAGDKSIIFENFIRLSLKQPIKNLNNKSAIQLNLIPNKMIKDSQIISSEGAKVSLSNSGKKGLKIDYEGISSRLEGRQSPCSSLIFVNGDFGARIDNKYYPAPDIWIINGKKLFQSATEFDQIQEACEIRNPANVSIILSDYSNDNSKVLQSSEGKIHKLTTLPMKFVDTATQSIDGSVIALGAHNDIKINSMYKTIQSLPYFGAKNIFITKDNKHLIATRYRGEIEIFDLNNRRKIAQISETSAIMDADLSPDEKFLALVTEKGEFRIIDLINNTTYKVHAITMENSYLGSKTRLWSVAYSPDGKKIAIGGDSNTLTLYNVNKDTFEKHIKLDKARSINSMLFLDNETLIVGGERIFAKLNIKTSEVNRYRLVKKGRYLKISSINISPNKRYLALTGSTDLIFDLKKNSIIDRIGANYADIKEMIFLSNNKFISVSHDHKDAVTFWEF